MRIHRTASILAALLLLACPVSAGEAFDVQKAGVVPDLKKLRLKTLSGEARTLESFQGKVVVLNLCASWCAPCWVEFPSMQKLHERFKDKGLAVVALAVESGDSGKAARFKKKAGISFPMLVDAGGDAMELLDLGKLPVSYILARDGTLLGTVSGVRDWAEPAAIRYFEELLGKR